MMAGHGSEHGSGCLYDTPRRNWGCLGIKLAVKKTRRFSNYDSSVFFKFFHSDLLGSEA